MLLFLPEKLEESDMAAVGGGVVDNPISSVGGGGRSESSS